MKSKNLWYILVVVLIMVSCIFIGIKTKKSFNLSENVNKNIETFSIYKDQSLLNFYDQISEVNDLLSNSDIVVKISITEDRESVTKATLTKVKVNSILKGNIYDKEYIYIYEPYFIRYFDCSISNYQGYLPMRKGEEYIVFLKELNAPEGYNKTDKENMSYLFVNPIWGKYNSKAQEIYTTNNIDMDIKLGDVNDKDAIIMEQDVEKYNSNKKIIDEKFSNN